MRTMMPMRALQVATTAAALLVAQAPAFAQTAPTPTAAPAPAPTAAPAPAAAPAPTAAPTAAPTRAPAPDLPVEPEPLPPWTPSVEPTPPATPTPPPGDAQTPPGDVQAPLTDPNAPPPTEPPPADVAPAPAPAPMAPVDVDKAKGLRKAGVGTMAAGGVLALGGFVATLAFTLRGNKLEQDLITAEGNYQIDNCSSTDSSKCDGLKADRDQIRDGILGADRNARITGGVLAGGLLITAIGGIIYRVGMKRLSNADNVSRVRVSPSFGGLTISGRF